MNKKLWLIGLSIIAISILAYRFHTEKEIKRELERISSAKYHAEEAVRQAYYKVSFDPQSCRNKLEQGNVFIAIGEQVFRVKWDEQRDGAFIRRISFYEKDIHPIPIDIGMPEGCFENPIHAESFSYKIVKGSSTISFGLKDSRRSSLDELIRREWDYIQNADEAKCQREDDVFTSCRQYSPIKNSTLYNNENTAMYKAEENKYKAADGTPFIISCRFSAGQNCEYSYDIIKDVALLAYFTRHDPTSKRHDNSLPHSRTVATSIANDIEIRKVVNKLHIKNYPWNSTHTQKYKY